MKYINIITQQHWSASSSHHTLCHQTSSVVSSRQNEAASFWACFLRNGHANVLSVKSFTLLMHRQLSQACRILFKPLALTHSHSLVMLETMKAFHILIDTTSLHYTTVCITRDRSHSSCMLMIKHEARCMAGCSQIVHKVHTLQVWIALYYMVLYN